MGLIVRTINPKEIGGLFRETPAGAFIPHQRGKTG